MSITSINFFFALIIVLAIYYMLSRRAQNYWLLIVSYAFCITWAWQFSLLLIGITAFNFFLAKGMSKIEKPSTHLLLIGISINVIVLLLFRVADFYLPGLISMFANLGIQLNEQSLKFLLPIGLAYFTLQNISYLVDVHRKQTPAASDFIDFGLYLAYFPKILAGPIERARTFLPILAKPRRVDNDLLARSFTLIIIGLLRKVVIASILSAIIFWDAFETPGLYTGPELVGWLVLYGLFLYNDFAGYTSIARGISGLFGIELSQNFKQPYFARNLTEFWNSWHITLSHWLRDYIFFPITRSLLKRNPSRTNLPNLIIPPMATMLISGLWHGFGWHMLLWGGLHGLYQVIERLTILRGPVVPPQKWPIWRQVLSMLVVFGVVSFAWAPFVMELPVALAYWGGMFDWASPILRYRRILLFVPLLALTLLVDWLQRYYKDEEFFLRWPRLVQASLLAVSLLLLVLMMQSEQAAPFVYQGF
jgi:alginate O-acetyltransferase complex protein AlgI